MRKIIASLAMSLDGFIARANGDVDWLDRPSPKGNYGMDTFVKSIDTMVMGRGTYEVGKKLGGPLFMFPTTVILSRSMSPDEVPQAVIEKGNAKKLAARWRKQKGKDIWLMGGAQVFGQFLDAGELDELMIALIPVLIGEGIPLLDPKRRTHELSLKSSRKFSDGVVMLRYAASKAGRRA
jgi:dihydrofolate reductase